jgi:hypothetical protein
VSSRTPGRKGKAKPKVKAVEVVKKKLAKKRKRKKAGLSVSRPGQYPRACGSLPNSQSSIQSIFGGGGGGESSSSSAAPNHKRKKISSHSASQGPAKMPKVCTKQVLSLGFQISGMYMILIVYISWCF